MEPVARVLILDDEPVVGERLKATLERAGFFVEAFSTSREALDRLNEESFDILVTDLKMSGPDGLDVLQAARNIHPDIKPVVITGFATRDTAEKVLASGAVAFLAKPFKMSRLRQLLLQLMGQPEEPEK